MPGTWSVYTDPAATCNVHRTRGRLEAHAGEGGRGLLGELCGVPRGLCGRYARKTPELQLFTSAGGENEVETDGIEETREGARVRGPRGEGEGRNICVFARRFRAVSGNKRRAQTTEKVSVARFARVHLTKKSDIYFLARTTKHFWNLLFATSRKERG